MSHLRLLACTLGVLVVSLGSAGAAGAASTQLFFSEYIEGSSNNKALEIYNGTPAAVNLAGYDVQMYFNGSTSAGLTISLVGTVAPGDVFVLAHSSAALPIVPDQTNGAGWFNGNDAVVLRQAGVAIDVIGQIGFNPGTEWGTGLTSTADNTLRRKLGVTAGDTNGADAFDPAVEWDGFAQNTFDGLGGHGGVAGVVATCGSALSTVVGYPASRNVSAADADGFVTSMSIVSVTPSPAPGSIALGGFSPSASFGGPATATVTVDGSVPAGTYSVVVSASNNDVPTAQTGSCTLSVNVIPIRTIGEVQGAVTGGVGILHRSPFAPPTGGGAGQTVAVQGVVYEKTLARSSGGSLQNGFFLQNTAAQADGDPLTSDGVFVFIGSATAIGGGYTPQVGDEIVLTGRVTEFFNFTELTSSAIVQVLSSGVLDVDAAVPAFDADPPDDAVEAGRYWERREGARGRVPAGARVTDGLDHFVSTSDTEMWLMRGDNPLASRLDPYAQRPFRDAHPLDNDPSQLFDDGNGYRIMVSSYGVRATAADSHVLLSPSRTFDTVTNDLVGGVYVSFDKYSIATAEQPVLVHGVDPALNGPPTAFARADEYSVGDYNVENLYDYRDDPFDGCDFTGNTGCPGVSPPFDYVPASDAVYQERLGLIAEQITGDLHAPDIILVQEAEDQDICTVSSGALACGATDNADGKPDTLQELALRIEQQGGPAYDAAYDRDGSDDRGIVAALMYRTDRVELLPATAAHPVLGSSPQVVYRAPGNAYNSDVQNPKALNAPLPGDVDTSTGVDGSQVYTRDPQVGFFRVWRQAVGFGGWVDVYAISNHFSSTPDRRVGQRREQAAYLAAIVAALGPGRVIAGGDFNVYPRPDDPLQPASDQLGPLYDQGLSNLWDTLVAEVPAAAYSYVFVGQAQTLDGQFVTGSILADLEQTRVAHVNSDWPADFAGDGARGLSDHDPMASRFALEATLEGLEALLAYYRDSGAITGNNTFTQLQHHLEQSLIAHDAQLRAFINQVRGKAPRFITQAAADALVAEAARLLHG